LLMLLVTLPRRRFLFIVFYVGQMLYMAVNLSYHFSFDGYLHISQYLGLCSEAFDLVKHSAVPGDVRLLWVLADVPFAVGLFLSYSSLSIIPPRIRVRILLYGCIASLIVFFWRTDATRDTIARVMNDPYSSDISVVNKYGLFAFNIVDLVNYHDGIRLIKRISYGPEVSSDGRAAPHPDIVTVQVESLDAYIVEAVCKNVFIAPYFHELASTSVYYPFMLSYHEAGSTSDCEFSTINSIEPFESYPSIKIRNYDYANSFLPRLTAAGYENIAFHGNRGSYFNRSAAFKKMGFSRFYDIFGMGLHETGWGAPDKSVFDFITAKLRAQREPFFYYVITMSSHEPFTLTRSYYRNDSFKSIDNVQTRDYFTVISYVDREVREFVRNVRNIRPGAYIFIWGDHTPVIGKDIYKRASFPADNKIFEFVPLFIITPDSQVFRETRYAVSFVDVAPTVLAASGSAYRIRSNGTNLLARSLKDGPIAYRGGEYMRSDLYKRINPVK
jgi:lipoteichoic acid synthase